MFERFLAHFQLLPVGQSVGIPWRDHRLSAATGYSNLMARFAGCSFENGLYRLHDNETGPRGAVLLAEAFPEFAERACPFGYDWLGRQFALDPERVENEEPLALLVEPGTGEVLELPFTFAAFHEQLYDIREPALAAGFFSDWADANRDLVPVKPSECVGYRVPLFLGGEDAIDNLEVIDLEVYWSLCGQLRRGTRRLPAGTSIREVSMSPDLSAG